MTNVSRILRVSFNIPISMIHYVSISIFLFIRIFIKLISGLRQAVEAKRVIIYGAGETGFVVKRVIMSNPDQGFNVRVLLMTIKVFMEEDEHTSLFISLQEFIKKNRIDSLVLAFRSKC